MASRNPLGKLIGTALETAKETVKDPMGTATKVVGEGVQLTRAVTGALKPGRKGGKAAQKPGATGAPAAKSSPSTSKPDLRPVADPAASGPQAVPAEASRKEQGDPLTDRKTEPTPKPAAKKPAAKKAPAKKAPAKQAPTKKAPSAKAAVTAPAAASAEGTPSGKLPAKKSSATKAATKKAPAKKAPAKKAPAKKAAAAAGDSGDKPLSAAELAAGGPDVETPVGTTGADVATNPSTTDTDLQQPGTEPLVDPATAKSVASEAETLQKAADPDKSTD